MITAIAMAAAAATMMIAIITLLLNVEGCVYSSTVNPSDIKIPLLLCGKRHAKNGQVSLL